jgi:hypothetical protein
MAVAGFASVTLHFSGEAERPFWEDAVRDLTLAVKRLGGNVAVSPDDAAITHLVQSQEDVGFELVAGVQRCSLLWVLACCEAGDLLPLGAHPLYRPPSSAVRGARSVCVTGFTGARRMVFAALLEALGANVSMKLTLSNQPVLVANDLATRSAKLDAAR